MQRILVIFPGALGDLVCVGPALAVIRKSHGDAEIELMAREELARLAVGRMGIARGHSIDRPELAALFSDDAGCIERARGFFGQFAHIHSFFAFENSQFRKNMIELSAPAIATFYRFRPEGAGHVSDAYVEEVAGSMVPVATRFELLAEDVASAQHATADVRRFVVIFPGSGSAKKNWGTERFIALANSIYERHVEPVFVLGPAEIAIESRLRASGYRVIKDIPLGTVAAIARVADAFIGVDSGVSHLAAAAGARGIVLFGPTDPRRWAPLGAAVAVIHREPMDRIEPAEVAVLIDEIVAEKNASR
ncbi:MAG TPA: glycosyltransferase family 9 protein [Candidatus Binataceae bacterium]|nr:glycosyltransferase family 9 protein [Candidatus Binataceae bacterium]